MNLIAENNIPAKEKERIRLMFNSIAKHYDFLNHFLSLGIDYYWRKRVMKILKSKTKNTSSWHILDVATGTADLAIQAASLKPEKIIGIDISEEMLNIGLSKIKSKKLDTIIDLKIADCESIPYSENSFDAVTVAFGVRNFENHEKGLSEIYRVLNNKGILAILEFTTPTKFPVKQIYNFYFKNILPLCGKIISKHNSAYKYLPASVNTFPHKEKFVGLLDKIGFKNISYLPVTFGIVTIYTGEKR